MSDTITAADIRTDLAMVQATLAMLSEQCRTGLEELAAAGDLDVAGDKCRDAFAKLEGAMRYKGAKESGYFDLRPEPMDYGQQ